MKFIIEAEGDARGSYAVTADSEEEARKIFASWDGGPSVSPICEEWSATDIVSVRVDR